MATITNNAKAKAGTGVAGRTRIINLAKSNMTQAELDAAILYLSAGDVAGTNDAHTVAGVSVLTESGVFTSGTTDAVQVAIQGTGVATMATDFGIGSTGITATLIADFVQ
jgi:indole-3-glycerol phosphate synthase